MCILCRSQWYMIFHVWWRSRRNQNRCQLSIVARPLVLHVRKQRHQDHQSSGSNQTLAIVREIRSEYCQLRDRINTNQQNQWTENSLNMWNTAETSIWHSVYSLDSGLSPNRARHQSSDSNCKMSKNKQYKLEKWLHFFCLLFIVVVAVV